jgi:hypothetical protein
MAALLLQVSRGAAIPRIRGDGNRARCDAVVDATGTSNEKRRQIALPPL